MREALGRCLTHAYTCTWDGVRVVMRFAWRWWVMLSAVFIAAIGVCFTVHFWDWLTQQESPSATIRNAGLVIAAPVALILAVWRSIIAQKQAGTAEKNLINEQFKSGIELLGHESAMVRLGGIYTLSEMGDLYSETLYVRVMKLFETFLTHPPTFESDQEHKKGEVDFGSRDILENLKIINTRTNAALPALGGRDEIGRISGSGWALGYWGGLASLALVLGLIAPVPGSERTVIGLEPILGLDPERGEGARAVGPLSVLWYIGRVQPVVATRSV